MCCIPFFTYGIALGDLIHLNSRVGVPEVAHQSGRRVIRVALKDRAEAETGHEQLHGSLVTAGALHEFSGSGYVAVDVENELQVDAVVSALQPLVETGVIIWEWGSD